MIIIGNLKSSKYLHVINKYKKLRANLLTTFKDIYIFVKIFWWRIFLSTTVFLSDNILRKVRYDMTKVNTVKPLYRHTEGTSQLR